MSTEQIVGSATLPELPDLATHKRKSFQYTALGAQLKNNIPLALNTTQSTINLETRTSHLVPAVTEDRFMCVLPSKRQCRVKIVVKTPKINIKNKAENREVKKTKIVQAGRQIDSYAKQQSVDLLTKFLLACKELQNNDGTSNKVVSECQKAKESRSSTKGMRRMQGPQPEERWRKTTSRVKAMVTQLDRIEQSLALLK